MKATLYFDGKCPLCRREIRLLKRVVSSRLRFVDVHGASLAEDQRAAMLQQLHLQTADGKWLVGLAANVAAWRMTPLGFLFAPLLWPGIKPVAEHCYQRWAARRARRCEWIPPMT
ncbi:DUF393 domain-containing protein [Gilvimarinus sp. SDUM040013]|uniref:DUF393 domain-containing protein n=1 Tax=Gilvimarinus gilvus TaxID=3058038 RepID=A0ABU4RV97_9GAMM|nr:DUF393 domain-containing protein [Gilvimarinus sp. SDUM040013]MDO3387844.1 DUF393 domain-containing protein [Gilvimarinus sp. SDUM040013]MDX6848785.1 DUF393 domain-containing protein [Gilvimarinus sp. SDUM040013]